MAFQWCPLTGNWCLFSPSTILDSLFCLVFCVSFGITCCLSFGFLGGQLIFAILDDIVSITLISCSCLLSLLLKRNIFVQLLLFEVCLIFICFVSLRRLLVVWFFLPVLGLGAAEGSLGLSLLVHLSRTGDHVLSVL